jgi:hypothetical protein
MTETPDQPGSLSDADLSSDAATTTPTPGGDADGVDGDSSGGDADGVDGDTTDSVDGDSAGVDTDGTDSSGLDTGGTTTPTA